MRRIIVTCAAAAALTYVLLSTTGTGQAEAQSKKAAKAAKAAPAPTYGNADAITENELKVYDYFLASDQLEGRYFPSRGYDTAALYVASHLAEWGLKPGGSTTGTNGPLQPYMMPIEMVAREIVPEDSKATLVAPAAAAGGRGAVGSPAAAVAVVAAVAVAAMPARKPRRSNMAKTGPSVAARAGVADAAERLSRPWT